MGNQWGRTMRDPHDRQTLDSLRLSIAEPLGVEFEAILTSARVLLARFPSTPSSYKTYRALGGGPSAVATSRRLSAC
jgi:hypothetical protein